MTNTSNRIIKPASDALPNSLDALEADDISSHASNPAEIAMIATSVTLDPISQNDMMRKYFPFHFFRNHFAHNG